LLYKRLTTIVDRKEITLIIGNMQDLVKALLSQGQLCIETSHFISRANILMHVKVQSGSFKRPVSFVSEIFLLKILIRKGFV
jgi:hypothetical protein